MTTAVSDPAFRAYAPGFDEVLGDDARLSLVAEVDAHEGPVYLADEDALYFTTLPRPGTDRSPFVQIKRLPLEDPERISVLVAQTNGANGMTADRNGRLLVCEQGSRWQPARIARVDRGSGERETVVESWRGLPFNSPNDVVVASDGAIWFTDPTYGHLQGFSRSQQVGDFVSGHDSATGETTVVADGFDKPNGIAFSPDQQTLYGIDSGANRRPAATTSTGPITSGHSTSWTGFALRVSANSSACCTCRRNRTTSPGATMTAAPSTSPPRPASTASGAPSPGSARDDRTKPPTAKRHPVTHRPTFDPI